MVAKPKRQDRLFRCLLCRRCAVGTNSSLPHHHLSMKSPAGRHLRTLVLQLMGHQLPDRIAMGKKSANNTHFTAMTDGQQHRKVASIALCAHANIFLCRAIPMFPSSPCPLAAVWSKLRDGFKLQRWSRRLNPLSHQSTKSIMTPHGVKECYWCLPWLQHF